MIKKITIENISSILVFLFIMAIPFSGATIGLYLGDIFFNFLFYNIFLIFLSILVIIYGIKFLKHKKTFSTPPLILQFTAIVLLTIFYLLFQSIVTKKSLSLMYMLITGLLTYFVIYFYADCRKNIKWIEFSLFFMFFSQGLLGILQFFNPTLILGVIKVPLGEEIAKRVEGGIGHPGPYGVFLAVLWPLIFNRIIFLAKKKKWLIFTILSIVLTIGSIGIVFSLTRASWVGLVVSLFVLLIYSFKFKLIDVKKAGIIFLLLFIVLTTLLIFNVDVIKKRIFQSDIVNQIRFRNYLNKLSLRIIKDNLIFGIGVGNFKVIGKIYESWANSRVHNQYLYWLTEYGVVGFLFFFWLIFSIVSIGESAISKWKDDNFIFPITLAIQSSIWSLLVVNHSGLPMSHISIFILFCVLIGLISKIYSKK